MRFIYIITVILVLLIQCVTGINAGENYELINLPTCYGPVTAKIRWTTPPVTGEYEIQGFKKTSTIKKEDIWERNCNNKNGQSLSVVLVTANETKNVYDIRLQYYINQYQSDGQITDGGLNEAELQNDNNRRTQTFTNVQIGPAPVEKKPFEWPEFPGGGVTKWGGIAVIVLIIIFIVGGGLLILYKIFFKSDDEVVSEATLSGNMQEPTDEEVLEYIRRNVK